LLESASDELPDGIAVKGKILKKLMSWNSYWKPYEELTDDIKEYDRVYARKIIDVLKEINDG